MKFVNRSAVVTGGAGRVGRPLCEKLSDHGVAVAIADLDLAKAEELAAALRARGGQALAYPLDVTSTESVNAMARSVLADFEKVDILINNAGVWKRQLLSEMSEAFWTMHIDLNLTGTFRVTKAFLPGMQAAGYGRIINLSSIAGEVGLPYFGAYAAAKAGVIIFTKTLAMEHAKQGITVNCVSPGMIGDAPNPTKTTWVERYGLGHEVADLLVFLASDDTSFITGVDYTIDGGRILGPRFADV
jgi:NAD(P)-dependent dehydrogenase (short-subunit alcohol dehydrogenase family)